MGFAFRLAAVLRNQASKATAILAYSIMVNAGVIPRLLTGLAAMENQGAASELDTRSVTTTTATNVLEAETRTTFTE